MAKESLHKAPNNRELLIDRPTNKHRRLQRRRVVAAQPDEHGLLLHPSEQQDDGVVPKMVRLEERLEGDEGAGRDGEAREERGPQGARDQRPVPRHPLLQRVLQGQ